MILAYIELKKTLEFDHSRYNVHFFLDMLYRFFRDFIIINSFS